MLGSYIEFFLGTGDRNHLFVKPSQLQAYQYDRQLQRTKKLTYAFENCEAEIHHKLSVIKVRTDPYLTII